MKRVVLAISGSLRKPSFTEKMLDLCLEGVASMGEEFEVHFFHTVIVSAMRHFVHECSSGVSYFS